MSELSGIPNQLDKDQRDRVFPQLSSSDKLHVTNSRLVRMSPLSHTRLPSCDWPNPTQHNDMHANHKSWHNYCRQNAKERKFSGSIDYAVTMRFFFLGFRQTCIQKDGSQRERRWKGETMSFLRPELNLSVTSTLYLSVHAIHHSIYLFVCCTMFLSLFCQFIKHAIYHFLAQTVISINL